jgi:hypothetical protein
VGYCRDTLGRGLVGRLAGRAWLGVSGCAPGVAGTQPRRPTWARAALAFAFGRTASGWNGVFLAGVARSSQGRGAANTGALLVLSCGGLVAGPLLYAGLAGAIAAGAGCAVIAVACMLDWVPLRPDRATG